ncbi:hypothetical protein, partial [Arsenophonus sp.]|uniref:hypothetical protein n=1 Tax=Arsenophonus sp. TaxID=1872640 RepID=UPI00387A751F
MNLVPKGKLTGRECQPINPSKRAEVYYAASVKHLISLFKLVVKQEISRENQQKNLGDASPVNDHRKLIHFLAKSDQSKLIHCFTQLLLLSAAYLSIDSFHRLIEVHA